MHEFHVALTLLGAMVLGFGFFSIPIEKCPPISRPILALAIGIAIGPHGLNWLSDEKLGAGRGPVLETAASLTMAIALMGVALRLPPKYFRQNFRSMAIVLGVLMPLMWLTSGMLSYLILGLPIWVALLAGAIVSPTDPVLATTVVNGKVAEENLPERIRHGIAAEAGANDGLAYPLVFLPVLMLTLPREIVWNQWLVSVLLKEVVGAVVLGGALGYFAGRAMRFAEQRKWMEEPSILAITLALSLFSLGAGELVGVNAILAVFCAGIGFDNGTDTSERVEEQKIQESINQFFTVPIFALFGLFIPWAEWGALGWRAVALAGAVLLLRRLPWLLLLRRWIPIYQSRKDAGFVGWFGPIGAAALYYAVHVETLTVTPEVWVVGSLIVFASVIVHGITETALTKRYSRSSQQRAGEDREESLPAA